MNLDFVILNVPVVGRGPGIEILPGEISQQVTRDSGFTYQVFALIRFFHQLAAQAIDRLALLVHDVVVLEQVFARFEVAAFDRFLRGGNSLGNHL